MKKLNETLAFIPNFVSIHYACGCFLIFDRNSFVLTRMNCMKKIDIFLRVNGKYLL